MLAIVYDSGFERDVKAQQRKHRDIAKLKEVIALVVCDTPDARQTLVTKYKDHALVGGAGRRRECHIDHRQDWLLAYVIDEEHAQVTFVATGSHDYLFGKQSRL